MTQTLTASMSQQFNQLSEMLGCTLGFQPLQKFPIARYVDNPSLNPARNQDGDQIAILNANFVGQENVVVQDNWFGDNAESRAESEIYTDERNRNFIQWSFNMWSGIVKCTLKCY